jgi:hypothetical protein
MRRHGRCGWLFLAHVLSVCSPAAFAGGAIYLKASPWVGLSDDEQTFLSQPRSLDSTDLPGAGLAMEWRFSNGIAVGAEYIGYSHDYTPPAAIPPIVPRSGEATVRIIALTLRKYFGEPGGLFYPYVGLGIGTSDVETSHPLPGAPPVYNFVFDTYNATAYQISAGMEVRFFPTKKRHLGMIVEAKHMGYSSVEANRYDPTAMAIFIGIGLVRD